MTIIELIRALAEDSPVAICLTDAQPAAPGPLILYANPAFALLTGRPLAEVIGVSPRFMQGRETRRPTLDLFAKALAEKQRFHGQITNYRGDGAKYLVEIDCRPLLGPDGEPTHFLAFEREVARRRGRPGSGVAGRFEPVSVPDSDLPAALRSMAAFASLPPAAEHPPA
ncbi:PAS domain-containing protein [Hansschlegelia beijingensis]|uniref:PAS domain-containing protein n=1 Tax=Hansschlegelia beijingensis TaxID=1133344 RepID=UPI003822ADED